MRLSTFQKGLILALVAIILAVGLIFVNRIMRADFFDKEEAQHAIYGLWLAKDIKALELGNFIADTQRQIYWPFLHSWLLSAFFVIFGASDAVARLLSLALFIATLLMMYEISSRLSERSGMRIGLLAVFLALSSPMMVSYSAQNTLEALGAFIFLSSFYLYIIAEEQKSSIYYVFLAVAVGLSVYTSYLYAYFIIPAFIVVALGKLGPVAYDVLLISRRGERAALPFFWWAYRKLVFLTVLFVIVGTWFLSSSFSRKIMLFTQSVFRNSGGELPSSFGNALAFYPLALIRDYSFSPWLGLLMFGALFLPIIAFHHTFRPINKLFTFIWTVLLLATLTVPTKAPQFIYVIAPFFCLVFSAAIFYAVEKYPRYAASLLIVVFVPAIFSLPNLGKIYFPAKPAEGARQVLDYYHQSVPRDAAVAASFNLKHLNPEGLSFRFADWKAPVLTDPSIGEEEVFGQAQYFLAIELEEGSPYASELLDDSHFSWNNFLGEKLKQNQLAQYSQLRLPAIGVTAKIYKR